MIVNYDRSKSGWFDSKTLHALCSDVQLTTAYLATAVTYDHKMLVKLVPR
jgi:hypothetical protein